MFRRTVCHHNLAQQVTPRTRAKGRDYFRSGRSRHGRARCGAATVRHARRPGRARAGPLHFTPPANVPTSGPCRIGQAHLASMLEAEERALLHPRRRHVYMTTRCSSTIRSTMSRALKSSPCRLRPRRQPQPPPPCKPFRYGCAGRRCGERALRSRALRKGNPLRIDTRETLRGMEPFGLFRQRNAVVGQAKAAPSGSRGRHLVRPGLPETVLLMGPPILGYRTTRPPILTPVAVLLPRVFSGCACCRYRTHVPHHLIPAGPSGHAPLAWTMAGWRFPLEIRSIRVRLHLCG